MPPHAYVPGQTERHDEDLFDQIKASVTEGIALDHLQDTQAFRAGLAYLEAGYFWECHEVLEAVWLQTPLGSSERQLVQALIQLANARLKQVMNRPNAVRRLCKMVLGHLDQVPQDRAILGIIPDAVRTETMALLADRELQENA